MADSAYNPLLGHGPINQCERCWAMDQAMPTEAQLKLLVSQDLGAEDLVFHPKAMNQDQAVAAEILTAALSRYVRHFGVHLAGARMNAAIRWLRVEAKIHAVHSRILEARQDINRRAELCRMFADGGSALDMDERLAAILAEPTPDYPGKAEDDAWLAEGRR
jgi:hypothetical protein